MPTEHLNKSGPMDLRRTIRTLIVSHSAVLYSGVAEVVRQIFSSIIQAFPNRYTVEHVGLLHPSAVPQVPWPIAPTRLVHSTNGSVALDPNDLFGELTVPDIVDEFDPDIVFCHNDPQADPTLDQAARTSRVSMEIRVCLQTPNLSQSMTAERCPSPGRP